LEWWREPAMPNAGNGSPQCTLWARRLPGQAISGCQGISTAAPLIRPARKSASASLARIRG
jgi:hypothetical protein